MNPNYQPARWLLAGMLVCLLAGCGEVEKPPVRRSVNVSNGGRNAAKPAAGNNKKAVAPASGYGSIKGKVIWANAELPAQAFADVQKEKEHCLDIK